MSDALTPHYQALMSIYSDPDMITETSPLVVADVMQHAVASIEELQALNYRQAELVKDFQKDFKDMEARQLSPELLDKIISIVLQGYGFGISKRFPLEQVRRDILKELGEQG